MTKRRTIAALLIALLAFASVVNAQFGDSGIGRLAARWLEAYNSGDEAQMRAFNTRHVAAEDLERVAMDERLNRYRALFRETGALEISDVMRPGPGAIVLIGTTATGERIRVTLEGDGGNLTSVAIAPDEENGHGPPDVSGPPISEAALLDSIDALIARNVADDTFSGVVRIVDGERVVYEKAAGLAERRFDVPNTIDTRFNIGSITKMFTHVAIAKLASEGKLAPEDRLSKHLPDYPKAVAERITIAQLLDHSSGLGDIFGPEYDAMNKSRLRTLEDFLPLFRDKPLRFEPGTDQYYSNAGFTVLGLVIERLSGMPYADYIRQVVYEPAGMTDSGPGEVDRPVPGLATGYTRRPRTGGAGAAAGHGRAEEGQEARTWELRANTYDLPGLSSSAGGGYSTARDLERFARALRHDRLLPPAYTQWIFTRELKTDAVKPSLEAFPPGAGVGLGGGAPGLNAVLEMQLDRDLTLVVMANADPPIAERMGRRITGWMRRAGLGGEAR